MIGMVVVDIRERMRYRDGPNGRLRSGFIALGKSFRITAILKGQKNSAFWAVNDEPCWFDSSPGHDLMSMQCKGLRNRLGHS